MERTPFVYILASKRNGTIYTGATSNLVKRIYEHKYHLIPGFSKKYNVTRLVWYEQSEDMLAAIAREKQNPDWIDLYKSIL